MHEFSDRPFVAGSMRGLRSFRIDGLNRLTGVAYKDVWRPGENVGECKRYEEVARQCKAYEERQAAKKAAPDPASRYTVTLGGFEMPSYYSSMFGGLLGYSDAPPPADPDPHDIGALACQCGFYAYFDDAGNRWHGGDQGQMYGVIEAYGVITIGSRGFRAQKAKILGLVAKPKLGQVGDTIAALYGVPKYGSKRELLEALPLTPPPVPTPETDDDFWTRSAS